MEEKDEKWRRRWTEPIPEERLMLLRQKLLQYKLNYSWLVAQLRKQGVEICREDISMYLAGRRKGPKAVAVIDLSFTVLERYAKFYGEE